MLYFKDLVHHLFEFIEVATHTILFVRQVYPKHLFMKTTKYDTPVMLCRSPIVIEYIQQALNSVRTLVEKACLERLCISTLHSLENDNELERFVFQFSWLNQITFDTQRDATSKTIVTPVVLEQLNTAFKAMLLKLSFVNSLLPSDTAFSRSFKLSIHMTKEAALEAKNSNLTMSEKWMPLPESYPTLNCPPTTTTPLPLLIPINMLDLHVAKFELFLESLHPS